MIVVLGQDDLNNSADPGEITFQVERYWLHEDFQWVSLINKETLTKNSIIGKMDHIVMI